MKLGTLLEDIAVNPKFTKAELITVLRKGFTHDNIPHQLVKLYNDFEDTNYSLEDSYVLEGKSFEEQVAIIEGVSYE